MLIYIWMIFTGGVQKSILLNRIPIYLHANGEIVGGPYGYSDWLSYYNIIIIVVSVTIITAFWCVDRNNKLKKIIFILIILFSILIVPIFNRRFSETGNVSRYSLVQMITDKIKEK